jgi:hypothetical protein
MDSEYEVMFRAFGWNNQDQIVHYDQPRRTYEEAEADFDACFRQRGVFSVGVEKRTVKVGTVAFVGDLAALAADLNAEIERGIKTGVFAAETRPADSKVETRTGIAGMDNIEGVQVKDPVPDEKVLANTKPAPAKEKAAKPAPKD